MPYWEYDYCDEVIDEFIGGIQNLKILLNIKKELGASVDISERYFGSHQYSCDDSMVFTKSAIAVILDLDEIEENEIKETIYETEEFTQEYPDETAEFLNGEVGEILLPAVYADICQEVFESDYAEKEFIYRKIDDQKSHIIFDPCNVSYYEYEDFFDFFIKVRKEALRLEVTV